MSDPVEDRSGVMKFPARRLCGPVDHDHRQAEDTGRRDLGIGPGPARVFRHDDLDPMVLHEGAICGLFEWATVHDDLGLGERQGCCGRIDEPQQVAMLRVGGEVVQVHPAHGEHDTASGLVERGDSPGHIRHPDPVIARHGPPFRPREGHQWDAGACTGGHRVMAHLRRKGMCCIDDMGDAGLGQVARQPVHPAEAAHPLRQGLAQGARNAARKGHGADQPTLGGGAGKTRGLGRACKDQEVGRHV